jgi:hypothetical protein
MVSLIDNLKQAGKVPVPLAFPDGSRLLALPESGRMLGLFMPGTEENVLWTNPALATAESATAYFTRSGWPNPGGDRTWLAPEIELFIGDLARPRETYAVPTALDPGCWRYEAAAHCLRLRNESAVHLQRSGREARFSMSKEYRPAANPLRDLKLALSYAGYEQTTVLELEADRDGGTAPARLGVWNLLQLPKPGRMIVPTYRRTVPRTVFGHVPPGDLTLGDHALVWRMADAGGNAKISVKAATLTGRAGYLYRSRSHDAAWNLVVRSFAVNPSGDYIDALWADPTDAGYVFQACAVNEGDETFNELEHHAPAVASAEGRNRSSDQSQLWAFRGGPRGIAEAAHILLGIEDTTLFK